MGSSSRDQFCLKWNEHQSNLLLVFDQLLQNEELVDVTIACDGSKMKAHKVVLSACSPYFQSLFLDNPCHHPIVILKDVRYSDMKSLMDFMYKGEVHVTNDQLDTLLKTAEALKVRGLAEGVNTANCANQHHHDSDRLTGAASPTNAIPAAANMSNSHPPTKRKRTRPRHRDERKTSLSDSGESGNGELSIKMEYDDEEGVDNFSDSAIVANANNCESISACNPESPYENNSELLQVQISSLAARPLVSRLVDTLPLHSPTDLDSASRSTERLLEQLRQCGTTVEPSVSKPIPWRQDVDHPTGGKYEAFISLPLVGRGHKRYFQQKWTDRYMMVCSPDLSSMTCAMCKESLTSFKTDTIKKHIQRKHPYSLSLSDAERQAILETFSRPGR